MGEEKFFSNPVCSVQGMLAAGLEGNFILGYFVRTAVSGA